MTTAIQHPKLDTTREILPVVDGVRLVGDVVTWSIGGDWQIDVVNEAMTDAGGSVFLRVPRWRSCYRRALTRCLSSTTYDWTWIDTGSTLSHIIQVNPKKLNEDGTVHYGPPVLLRFEEGDDPGEFGMDERGNPLFPSPQHVADVIEDAKLLRGRREAGDVTWLIDRLFRKSGGTLARLRRGGCVYFVPYHDRATVEIAAKFVGNLSRAAGGTRLAEFTRLPVPDAAGARASAKDVLDRHIRGDIAALQDEIEAVAESNSAKIVTRRVEKIQEISARVRAYQSILDDRAHAISSRLEAMRAELTDRLAAIDR